MAGCLVRFLAVTLVLVGCKTTLNSPLSPQAGPGGDARPVASALTLLVDEDQSKTVQLKGTAKAGTTLSFSLLTQPTNGVISGVAPNITYTPRDNYHGSDNFTFRVKDGVRESDPATVSITVSPVPDTPLANDVELEAIDYQKTALVISASDADGDAVTPIVVAQPTHGDVTQVGSQFHYEPEFGYSGADEFTYKVSDGSRESGVAKVKVLSREKFCLRNPPALPRASNIHVIGVYESLSPSGSGSHSPGPVTVSVRNVGEPLTLVLLSYDPIEWRITRDAGAQIAKVIVQAFYPGDTSISGLDPATVVVKRFGGAAYGWEFEHNSGGGEYASVVSALRTELGKIETTFQGMYRGSNFTVPPTISSLRTVRSHYRISDSECASICTAPGADGEFAAFDAASADGAFSFNPVLTNQNRTLSVTGSLPAQGTVRTNFGLRCGKTYFELRVDAAAPPYAIPGGYGIAAGNWYPSYADYMMNGPSQAFYRYWAANDAIGVAVDLDAGKAHYRFSGRWSTGDPTLPSSGRPLNEIAYRIYRPFVFVLAGDILTANFGGTPFQHAVPSGFVSGFR